MARNIVPRTNKGADLGTPAKNWNTVYADSVIANNVQGENLKAVEQPVHQPKIYLVLEQLAISSEFQQLSQVLKQLHIYQLWIVQCL